MNLGVPQNFRSFWPDKCLLRSQEGANYQVMRLSALKKERRNNLHC